MNKSQSFLSHSAALTALFILGNGVMVFPLKSADNYTFLAFLVSLLAAILFYFCICPLITKLFTNPEKNKVFFTLFCFATALICLYFAVTTFVDFSFFLSILLLQDFSIFLSFAVFFITVILFSFIKTDALLKFCLLSCFFTAVVILFFFFASLGKFDLSQIFIFSLPNAKNFWVQLKPYFLNPLLSVFLVLVFEVLIFGDIRKRSSLWGVLLGFGLLGLCVLNSVLLFGTRFAGALDFPYASAVSTVTIGRLFTRLDGFSYFVYFSAAMTKIFVCIFLIKALFKKAKAVLR